MPNGVLLPGYFVRVRVPRRRATDALLVPDVALGSDQGGRYVLVVDKDDVVEQRKVEIGPLVGDMRVIDKGITADDRVVVAGMHARHSRAEGRSASDVQTGQLQRQRCEARAPP